MTSGTDSYSFAIHEAQRYLRAGNKPSARYWAQQAANLIPDQEDPWLILAAVASPRASIEYLNHALEINPNSARARKGMHWAIHRYRSSQFDSESQITPAPMVVTPISQRAIVQKQFTWRPVLIGFMILILGLSFWFGYPMFSKALKSSEPLAVAQFIVKASRTPMPTQIEPEHSVASNLLSTSVSINSPEQYTPPVIPTATANLLPTLTNQTSPVNGLDQSPDINQLQFSDTLATALPTSSPDLSIDASEYLSPDTPAAPADLALVSTPTDTSELLPTVTLESETTSTLEPPTDTPEPTTEPTEPPKKQAKKARQPNGQIRIPSVSAGQHWIDVDLSQQRVYAFEGDQIVNIFVVSTGMANTPTILGQYRIYVKYRATDMSGPGYYLPDVPYVMYFYKGYGLHGTYWHHNFGTPMSHGCVNLKTPEAQWLFEWASVGTIVNVHN